MWIIIVFSLMCLAIVALGIFSYTLLLQIRDLNLAVNVIDKYCMDTDHTLDTQGKLLNKVCELSEYQTALLKIQNKEIDSLGFWVKIFRNKFKCIEAIMWD